MSFYFLSVLSDLKIIAAFLSFLFLIGCAFFSVIYELMEEHYRKHILKICIIGFAISLVVTVICPSRRTVEDIKEMHIINLN